MTIKEIEQKLNDLLHEIELETIQSDGTVKLIKSFQNFYKRTGRLSERQQEVLEDIYEEIFG